MPDSKIDPRDRRFIEVAKFFPVAFVVCNIAGLYAIYMVFHILPMLADDRTYSRGIAELAIFNVLSVLLLVCYVQCIMVHPGTIPDRDEDPSWEYIGDDGTPNTATPLIQETKKDGQRRHCKWCAKYKPDRCHHCRVCRTCILKMDHHCPWIYNCVGFRNHKYFFLLLMYSALSCHFIMWTMVESVQNTIAAGVFVSMFMILFGETLAAFLALLVSVFFSFHIWLMLKGLTTIEFCEKSAKGTTVVSSYDVGLLNNVRAVLGEHVLLWLLPASPPAGRGVQFRRWGLLPRDVEVGRGLWKTYKKSADYGAVPSLKHQHGKRESRTYLKEAAAAAKPREAFERIC